MPESERYPLFSGILRFANEEALVSAELSLLPGDQRIRHPESTPEGEFKLNAYRSDSLFLQWQYQQGLAEGLWITWSANDCNQESERHYHNGVPQGTWNIWYGDGTLRDQSIFDEDGALQQYTRWSDNGQKQEEWHYMNGELRGPSTLWDRDGNKIHKRNRLQPRQYYQANWFLNTWVTDCFIIAHSNKIHGRSETPKAKA